MERLSGGIAAGVLSIGLLGCGAPEAAPEGQVAEDAASGSAQPPHIAAEAWSTASATEDPFAANAAERIRCSPFALRIEATWLEVDTSNCNYATVVYRFGADAAAGDVIKGEIAWGPLAAASPALGTLAFATTRAGVLWTRDVPIPSEAGSMSLEFELGAEAPAGSALYFNVRNHGANNWQLSPLRLEPPG